MVVDAAVVVFDVCDAESYHRAVAWIDKGRICASSSAAVFLVGNKVDVKYRRVIPEEAARVKYIYIFCEKT